MKSNLTLNFSPRPLKTASVPLLYIYIYISMYMYLSRCMYLCMYVCMYLCIYVCMYLCMYVSMYVCIYICMYLYIYIIYIYQSSREKLQDGKHYKLTNESMIAGRVKNYSEPS